MSDAYIPHKACSLAFGLQTAQGIVGDADTNLPIIEDTTGPNWLKHYTFFQYADGVYSKRHYFQEGEWLEGTIKVPVIPSMLTGDFYDWILGRTSEATYYQGYYGTLFRDLGHIREVYQDVKVKNGSLSISRTGMAVLDLSIEGLTAPYETGTFAGDIYEAKPYIYSDATLQMAMGDGSYGTPASTLAAENYTSNHTLEFDNMQESPADMITLNGEIGPLALPNSALPEWKGSFDRIFANADLYRDFLAGRECQYVLTMTHGTGAVATATMPRILIAEHPTSVQGSGILRGSGINFQALGSTDGSTLACEISESV